MGLLSNRIRKETLKAGDHVYSWRAKRAYAHHGIYVGDDKVIHFTRGRGHIDVLLASSIPARSTTPCLVCSGCRVNRNGGVTSSCLSCFLAGGALYRFEYAVSTAFFFAKVRGGTCTRAPADPDEEVVHRANYLLSNGFRDYNLFKNNCEDFAIYCKTGLLAPDQGSVGIGQSGQASTAHAVVASSVSTLSVMEIAIVATGVTRFLGGGTGNRRAVLQEKVEDKVQKRKKEEDQSEGPDVVKVIAVGAAIAAVIALPVVYCIARHRGDIGNRPDVQKVKVEDMNHLATPGQVQAPAVTTLVPA